MGFVAAVRHGVGNLTGVFAWIVQRLAAVHGIKMACIGAPFAWVALEFIRAHLPEIGFPWNLLGYPAAANLGFVQLTTVTGIYGLSFVVAAFNALLAWSDAGPAARPLRKLGGLAAAAACIIAAMLIGPRLVPRPQANHTARAVQLNFPEEPAYGSNWFATHASQLQEATRVSLASSGHHPDLLVWPEAPAHFLIRILNLRNLQGTWRVNSGIRFWPGPSSGRPQRMERRAPTTRWCHTTARCFSEPMGSEFLPTTKFTWCLSESTSLFR